MKHTDKWLSRNGETLMVTVLLVLFLVAMFAVFASLASEVPSGPKPQPTVTVTVTATPSDDGPQDTSADCWNAWICAKVAEGYKALDYEYDGHQDCVMLVGDTSLIECADGWKTTS
jgi:hypothetical protein